MVFVIPESSMPLAHCLATSIRRKLRLHRKLVVQGGSRKRWMGVGLLQHQRLFSMLVCDYRNISIDGSVRCWPSNRNARLLTLIRRASSVVPQDVVVLRTTGCILLGVHIVEQSRAEQVPIPTSIVHLNGATSSNIPFNHVFSPSSVLFALVEVVLAFRVVATTTPSTVLLI